jgi:hypothetical protein
MDLPEPTTVSLELFNLLGQRVLAFEENMPSGRVRLAWRQRVPGLAGGLYLLRAEAAGRAQVLRAPLWH